MAQSKIVVNGIKDKNDTEKLASHTEKVEGVRFVNVNVEQGYVVVTHTDNFNADAFKVAATEIGFSA